MHTGQMSRQEDVEMTTSDVVMHDEKLEKDITSTLVKLKKLKLSLLSDIVFSPFWHIDIGHAEWWNDLTEPACLWVDGFLIRLG